MAHFGGLLLRKFLLAGTLKNKIFHRDARSGNCRDRSWFSYEAVFYIETITGLSSAFFVFSSTCATAAMDAALRPENPSFGYEKDHRSL